MLRLTGRVIIIFLLMTGLSACGGGADPTVSDTPDNARTGEIVPGVSRGLPGETCTDASAFTRRQGSSFISLQCPGSAALASSSNTEVMAGQLVLNTDGALDGAWGMYGFGPVTGSELTGIELDLDPTALPEYLYIGLADYASGAWHWLGFPDPTASLHLQLPPGVDALNSENYVYLLVLAWGNASAAVARVALIADTGVDAFSATDGCYLDKTVISWGAAEGAEKYVIEYRNLDGGALEDWTGLAVIEDPEARSFEHTATSPAGLECVPFERYEYRGRWVGDGKATSNWDGDQGHSGTGPGDWSMYGREPRHQRRSPYAGPETPAILWSVQMEGQIDSGTVVAADGTIYTACGNWGDNESNWIYSINPDGSVKWKYSNGYIYLYGGSPLIGDDGTVYIGCLSSDSPEGLGGYTCAINPDGSLKWSLHVNTQGAYASLVPANDGRIYLGSGISSKQNQGALHKVNADGTLAWNYGGGRIVLGGPAVGSDGTVYAGVADEYEHEPEEFDGQYRLHAVNSDGTMRWMSEVPGVVYSPSIADDGTVYARVWQMWDEEAKVVAWDSEGTELWTALLSGKNSFKTGLAIGADGTVYTGAIDDRESSFSRVYALNPDGSTQWVAQLDYEGTAYSTQAAPTVDAAGVIYIACYNKLHALNPDGTVKWSLDFDGRLCRAPSIGPDGTLYIGCLDQRLYAIGESD